MVPDYQNSYIVTLKEISRLLVKLEKLQLEHQNEVIVVCHETKKLSQLPAETLVSTQIRWWQLN